MKALNVKGVLGGLKFSDNCFQYTIIANIFCFLIHKLVLLFCAGVGDSIGKIWTEQRRFMLRNLRDLGMGKKDMMEQVIGEEADLLSQYLLQQNERTIPIKVTVEWCS